MTESSGSFLLRAAPRVSVDRDGRRLIGGSPLRLMTLTTAGAELVAGWFDGNPVGPEPAHQALAHRLVEADLATPLTHGPSHHTGRLLVIIPVKNDTSGLAATLGALGHSAEARPETGSEAEIGGVTRIVVVDDGSEPAVDPAIGGDAAVPVTVVRRSVSAGPGNARNLGLSFGDAPTVVFVDAGVLVTGSQLQALAEELSVGDTIAVAPRIRSEILPARLARYERRWSPLDLGTEAGLVGPGRRISYVPSTCLAVRTSALIDCCGFDPDLRFGEDVDLVWRLRAKGWVRYVPDIEVTHPPRSTLGGFVRQRYRYGTSAGPLARRHGRAVAPARLDSRSAAACSALFAGFHRTAGLVAGSATAVYVAGLMRRGVPAPRAASLVSHGWTGTIRGLALATARTWWPLAVIAAMRPRSRPASYLLLGGWLRRVRPQPTSSRNNTEPVPLRRTVAGTCTDLALGIVDDSAYALGVWRGSIQARTALPLLPHIPIGRRATER